MYSLIINQNYKHIQMRFDNLDDLRVLVETARRGSLTAAAQVLAITPAAASATLKRLESQLNMRLFERTTRAIRLTGQGQTLLDYVTRAFELVDEGVAQACDEVAALHGTIRLTASPNLARNLLLPWFDEFLAQHPGVRLDLNVGDRLRDMVRDEVDLALRFGVLSDSGLVARKLASTHRIICAAPSYLRKSAAPQTPHDLAQHNCLPFNANGQRSETWGLQRGAERIDVKVQSDRWVNDNSLAQHWAVAGGGLLFISELNVRAALDAGQLLRVLPEWASEVYDLHAVLPGRRFVPKRIEALLAFLTGKFNL